MEFDGRIDSIRKTLGPLNVKTILRRRKDVYYLTFEDSQVSILYPVWASLYELVKPLVREHFPTSYITHVTIKKVSYRLGSLFEFISQIKEL